MGLGLADILQKLKKISPIKACLSQFLYTIIYMYIYIYIYLLLFLSNSINFAVSILPISCSSNAKFLSQLMRLFCGLNACFIVLIISLLCNIFCSNYLFCASSCIYDACLLCPFFFLFLGYVVFLLIISCLTSSN